MRLFLLCMLVACTKENDPTDTSASDFEPTGGDYEILSSISADNCGSWGANFNDSIDGFSLKITFPDADTARFHWVNVQDCPRQGSRVECATDEALILDDYAPDNDARIMYEDLTTLNWDTQSSASGTWKVFLSCEGTQCDLISTINDETYPCEIEMDWNLALKE